MPSVPFPHGESVVSIRMRHFIKPAIGAAGSFETFWEAPDPALIGAPVDQLGLCNAVNQALGDAWADLAWEESQWQLTAAIFYNGGQQHDVASNVSSIDGDIGSILHPSADQLPDSISLVIQRRTGFAGRNNRGRVFVPYLSELVSKNGFIETSYRATAKAMATAMTDVYTSGAHTCAARHWDRKNNVLKVVTECRALDALRTRKDREPYRAALPIG